LKDSKSLQKEKNLLSNQRKHINDNTSNEDFDFYLQNIDMLVSFGIQNEIKNSEYINQMSKFTTFKNKISIKKKKQSKTLFYTIKKWEIQKAIFQFMKTNIKRCLKKVMNL